MRNVLTALMTTGALLGVAGGASAGTKTTTFQVSATVNSNCVVGASMPALTFPAYTPGTGQQTGTTTLSAKCTQGSAVTISLNAGTTTGTSFAPRLLANGANTLQYNIYTDATYATVWGDGTGTTKTVTITGTGMANTVSYTVNAVLPDNAANQAVPTGTYTDTITATFSY